MSFFLQDFLLNMWKTFNVERNYFLASWVRWKKFISQLVLIVRTSVCLCFMKAFKVSKNLNFEEISSSIGDFWTFASLKNKLNYLWSYWSESLKIMHWNLSSNLRPEIGLPGYTRFYFFFILKCNWKKLK